MAKNINIWNTNEVSHEEFMKRCFGDDFWEKPEDERFLMAIKRALAFNPKAEREKEHKKRNAKQ